jgi:hypothetical protein
LLEEEFQDSKTSTITVSGGFFEFLIELLQIIRKIETFDLSNAEKLAGVNVIFRKMERVLEETLKSHSCTQSAEELDSLSQTSSLSVNIYNSLRSRIENDQFSTPPSPSLIEDLIQNSIPLRVANSEQEEYNSKNNINNNNNNNNTNNNNNDDNNISMNENVEVPIKCKSN